MNQDPAAKPARLVAQRTNGTAVTTSSIVTQIFARPLEGGQLAVLLLNRAEAAATLSVSWAELGLPRAQAMAVRDVVGRRDLPPATGSFSARVPPHDVVAPITDLSGHVAATIFCSPWLLTDPSKQKWPGSHGASHGSARPSPSLARPRPGHQQGPYYSAAPCPSRFLRRRRRVGSDPPRRRAKKQATKERDTSTSLYCF